MGYDAINPRAGSFKKRSMDHQKLYSAIHRARVTDVFVDKGTVAVTLENVAYSAQVNIPLLGLSAPPSTTEVNKSNFKSSSWGRYIPQVGDLLLVGFGSNGDLYSLGYHAIFYGGFEVADVDNETTGGIGWGETSGKEMKSGDWDFKSSRNCNVYLGEKASISSGPYSMTINQSTSDVIVTTPLLNGVTGNSNFLYGECRRVILPTDTEESTIPTTRAGTAAQEATFKLKWNGGSPEGQELVTWSIGDVIDDDGATAMLRLSDANVPQPVRRYFNCTDNSGYINSYTEMVDAGGNYNVSSSLGTEFKWDTLLASWEISNLSTKITSTTTVDISAITTCTIEGTAGVILDSAALVQLGGSSASEPMVLGLKWQSFISALLIALSSHTHPSPAGPTGPSADFSAQVASLTAQVSNSLSTKVLGS